MSNSKNKISIRFDDISYLKLDSYSSINEISKSDLIRTIINQFFDKSKNESDEKVETATFNKLVNGLSEINNTVITDNEKFKMMFVNILNTFIFLHKDKAKEIIDIWRKTGASDE